jgi:hypothetical protein
MTKRLELLLMIKRSPYISLKIYGDLIAKRVELLEVTQLLKIPEDSKLINDENPMNRIHIDQLHRKIPSSSPYGR